ncbi:MAG: ribonuclease HIII [Opitutales bacterium]|nr:ribonuclease HIII [Opitutales bacterium]
MTAKKQTSSGEKPTRTSYSTKLNDAQITLLKEVCEAKGWPSKEVPYAVVAFAGPKVNVTAYQSGKCLVQGKGTEDFVIDILEPQITGEAVYGYDEVLHPEWYEAHAGLDESGKGDLFGPLVSAAVSASPEAIRQWVDAGIKDSKTISAVGILRLDKIIRKTKGSAFHLVACSMPKYNELMAKPGANLNKLLAWQHARALENVLEKKWVPWGMLDQFSKRPLTQQYFRGKDFDLRMMTKAEADPVVAAASVLARAEFVRRLKDLEKVAGEPLRKGAGPLVKAQGLAIARRIGPERFGEIAKLHFKTAHEILATC